MQIFISYISHMYNIYISIFIDASTSLTRTPVAEPVLPTPIVYVDIYVCTRICIYMNIHEYTYTYRYVYHAPYVYVYIYECILSYTHINIHTYVHMHIYIYTYILTGVTCTPVVEPVINFFICIYKFLFLYIYMYTYLSIHVSYIYYICIIHISIFTDTLTGITRTPVVEPVLSPPIVTHFSTYTFIFFSFIYIHALTGIRTVRTVYAATGNRGDSLCYRYTVNVITIDNFT
jgi:hypothetical protein